MTTPFTILSQLKLANGNLNYQSLPQSFSAAQTNANGPAPGMVTATTGGIDVNLSQLAVPAICRIMNTDPTNYITIGVKIGVVFYPFMELLPGETYVLRLSRTVLSAGTVRLVANVASVNVLFECFDQ